MLRAILAVSKDGYVARSSTDDMSWTGRTDKKIFRILTASPGVMATSIKTAALMPHELVGRKLFKLSRYKQDGYRIIQDLEWFSRNFGARQAWLIGGQEILLEALHSNLIGEVHICRSSRYAYPSNMKGFRDKISSFLARNNKGNRWRKVMETSLLDVMVEYWRLPRDELI